MAGFFVQHIVCLIAGFFLTSAAASFGDPIGRGDVEAGLEAWVTSRGGVINGIEVHQFEGMGRGLLATSSLNAKDVVLSIPIDTIICRETAVKSAKQDAVRYLYEDIRLEEDVIALFLMRERAMGTESEWYPYIASLPEYVPQAAYFPSKVLELGQDRVFMQQAGDRRIEINKRFTKLQENLEELFDDTELNIQTNFVSEPAYMWALAVTASRALTFRGKKYLTPIADMTNYDPHPDPRVAQSGQFFLEHHQLRKDKLVIYADRASPQGSQFFEDYGDNANAIYLDFHGFVPKKNPFDCVYTRLNHQQENVDPALRYMRFKLMELLQVSTTPAACLTSPISFEYKIYQFLQIVVMNSHDLESCFSVHARRKPDMKKCDVMSPEDSPATPSDWEPSAEQLQFLVPGLFSKGNSYDTTLEADLVLVEQKGPSTRYNAQELLMINYRINQKRIIKDLLEGAKNGSLPLRKAVEKPKQKEAPQEVQVDAATGDVVEEEAPLTMTSNDADLVEAVNEFNDWIEAAGFPVNKVRAAIVPGMRVGTVATEAIAEGETYLAVPKSVIMDTASAAKSPPLENILALLQRSREADFFSILLHLVYETKVLGSKSRFWPYLRLLPSQDDLSAMNPPLMFDDGDMARLEGTDMKGSVHAYKKLVLRHWDGLVHFKDHLEGVFGDVLTEDVFRWAHFIMDSRCIWWNGSRHLVPLLDLVNCAPGPTNSGGELLSAARPHATTMDPDTAAATTRAAWAFEAGHQVYENYGQPNHIYYQYHGFTLSGNDASECALITVEIGSDDVMDRDPSSVRLAMREKGFYSGIQSFCVGGNKKWNEDERLKNWLAIKFNRVDATTQEVARDLKTILEERLRAFPLSDSNVDATADIIRHEKALLRKQINDLKASWLKFG